MEQTQYWIWTRTRYSSSRPHLSTQIPRLFVGSSYNESWAEKAFAKDTAGHIGGCIWPPRSYSCSFCRREFRSAQALGGHMNVHRRDRARLKQSFSRSEETTEDQQHPNPCMVMAGTRYQRQVSPLVNGAAANPNPNYCVPAASVTPRVSASFTGENWPEKNLFSPSFSSSSSTARENLKGSVFATTRSQEDYTPLRLVIIPESKLEGENLLSREFGLQRWGDPGGYNEETNCCNKRRRTDPTPAFFIRASSGDQQQVQPQVLNYNPVEELDLELRLGDAPKIK